MRTRSLLTIAVMILVLPVLAACGGSSKSSEPEQPAGLSVTSVSPDRGSMLGGYRAQVRGSGFSAGVTELTFGGVKATDVSASGDTTLNCTVPPSRESGAVDVAVTTSAGTATLQSGFTYNDAPRVFFLAPPAGWSGVTVSIVGLGFSNYGAGQPTVMFGTQQSLAPQVVNDTLMFATVPPNPGAGLVEVSVTNDNGTGTLPNGFLYTQSFTSKSSVSGTSVTGTSVAGTSVLGTAGFRGMASVLAPRAEDEDDTTLYAVITDLDTGIASGYVLSDDTGRTWEPTGVWPLAETTR